MGSGAIAAVVIAAAHVAIWCGLSMFSLAALIALMGERHPLLQHVGMQTFTWFFVSLIALFLALAIAALDRSSFLKKMDERVRVVLTDLRFPVSDPRRTVLALQKALVQEQALARQVEEWTFVFQPMLPPVPKPGDPVWESSPARPFDRLSGSPIPFNGGIAFTEDVDAVRLVVFHALPRSTLLGTVGLIEASVILGKAVFRLLNVIRPETIPDFTRTPIDEDDAPADLRPLVEFARRTLALTTGRSMEPETMRIAVIAVAMASYLSLIAGTILMLTTETHPLLAFVAGIFGAAGPALGWAAYREAFRERLKAHEAVFGPLSVNPVPGRDLVVLGTTVPVFLTASLLVGGLIPRLLELLSGTLEERQATSFAILLGVLIAVISLAFLALFAWTTGWKEVDEALAWANPSARRTVDVTAIPDHPNHFPS